MRFLGAGGREGKGRGEVGRPGAFSLLSVVGGGSPQRSGWRPPRWDGARHVAVGTCGQAGGGQEAAPQWSQSRAEAAARTAWPPSFCLPGPGPPPRPPGEETASVSASGSEADLRSELFLPLGHVTVTSCCWSGPSLPVGLSRASASSA